jgi:hypothetical protein
LLLFFLNYHNQNEKEGHMNQWKNNKKSIKKEGYVMEIILNTKKNIKKNKQTPPPKKNSQIFMHLIQYQENVLRHKLLDI